MTAVLMTGFFSGLPLALTGSTLQAWLTKAGLDLKTIGLLSLLGLPYTLKLLWSPFIDRYVPPVFGRRRGWLWIVQALLTALIFAMSFCEPVDHLQTLLVFGLIVAFFSATQDIIIDAHRTEILEESKRGLGVGNYIAGYRVAMLVSGAGSLILSDHFSWQVVYRFMALIMSVGLIVTFFVPEPKIEQSPPKNIKEAYLEPLREFLSRKRVWEVIVFIIIYKLDIVMAEQMMTPFFLKLGFSGTDIGAVSKGFGLVSTLIGGYLGGALFIKLGLYRALWGFGIIQGISNLTLTALATNGHSYPLFVAAIGIEKLCSGMGTTAYTAFLMRLCNQRFTATQYALLSSMMAIPRVLLGSSSGFLAESLGWPMYFLFCTLIMLPGLGLLTRFSKWELPPETKKP